MIMELLKRYGITPMKTLKAVGVVAVVLIFASFLLSLIGRTTDSLSSKKGLFDVGMGGSPGYLNGKGAPGQAHRR